MSIIGTLCEVRSVCVFGGRVSLCRGQDSYWAWNAYISTPCPQCGSFVGHIHLEKFSAQTHPGYSSYSHLGEKPLEIVFFFPI